jgi:hypothetical protein
MHRWIRNDDVLACFIAKYGETEKITTDGAAEASGITQSSFRMRVLNFKAIAGESSLNHWAKLSEKISKEYENIDRKEHEARCLKILNDRFRSR